MEIDELKELVVYGDLKDLVYKLNIIDVTEETLKTLLDLISVYVEVTPDDTELKLKFEYLTKLIDMSEGEYDINAFNSELDKIDVGEECCGVKHCDDNTEEYVNTLEYEYDSCDKDTGDCHNYNVVYEFVTDVELSKHCEHYVLDRLEKYIKNLDKLIINDVDVGNIILDIIDNKYLNDAYTCSNVINVTLTFDDVLVVNVSDSKITINLKNNNLKNKDFKELIIVNDDTTFTSMTDKEFIKHVNDMYVKWYSDNISKTINSNIVAKKEVPKPEYTSKCNTVLDIGDPYDMTINIITDEEHSQELIKDIYDSVSDINDNVSQHIMLESLIVLNVTTLLLSQTSNFNNVTYVVNTSTIELTCVCNDPYDVKLTFFNKKDDTTVVKVLPVKETGFLNTTYVYNAFSAVDF